MARRVLILTLLFFLLASYGYYYYFVDTLNLSEIVGSSGSPAVDIIVGIVDFDTGLTRSDVHHLSRKSAEWDLELREIQKLQDVDLRKAKEDRLLAEMMDDPAFRKMAQMTAAKTFGAAAALVSLLLGR